MTILVTGFAGQVGHELLVRLARRGLPLAGPGRDALDIAQPQQVQAVLRCLRPRLVINAAAYTAVDRAEAEPEQAYAVNRDGPRHLAAACRALDIPLIHISTDYVFSGEQAGPYREDDPVNPMGVYGRSKAEGEQAVRELLVRHIILRTAWVYGARGHNFVKTMLRLGSERDRLRVVADQRGCPTAAGDIAEAILGIAERILEPDFGSWGTYHYCGGGTASWHEFANAIFAIDSELSGRPPCAVDPITTAEYPTPARRPANSVLDCGRLAATFGIAPRPWREALREVLVELRGSV
jgi:dTDP-4-dehydrorhamnose reductase